MALSLTTFAASPPMRSIGTVAKRPGLVRIAAIDQKLGRKSCRTCDCATRTRKWPSDAPPTSSNPCVAFTRSSQLTLPSVLRAVTSFSSAFSLAPWARRLAIMGCSPQ